MNTSEIDLTSPAIKALGSLFKHSEVYLRDDGFPIDNGQDSPCPKHIRFKYDAEEDDDDNDIVKDDFGVINTLTTSVGTSEDIVLMEDNDLFREMSVLGLPLSFQTSKQQSSVQTKGKHRATKKKGDNCQTCLKDQAQVSHRLNTESWCHANLQDKSVHTPPLFLLDQADHFCSGSDVSDESVSPSNTCGIEKPVTVAVETRCVGLKKHVDETVSISMSSELFIDDHLLQNDSQMETNMISTVATSDLLEPNIPCSCMHGNCSVENLKEMDRKLMEEIKSTGLELGTSAMDLEDLDSGVCNKQTQVEMSEDSQMSVGNDSNDIRFNATCVGWSALWDSFYMRYYFYNTKTLESTWYPPPGMQNLAFGDISNASDELNAEVIGTSVNHASSHNEEQYLDGHDELVRKACLDDLTEDICVAKELYTKCLSSGSAMVLDIPSVLDGNCLDETVNKSFNGSVITQLSDSSSLSSTIEAVACDDDRHNFVHMDELKMVTNDFGFPEIPAATKQKKKRKNRRRKKSFNKNDNHEFQPVEEHYVNITKYWCQRYLLFSKFDDGIQMDEEGWFSVTPEAIARHHASRLVGGTVVDCFAGVGGNIIQFAKTSKHVIAIDIDPKKIDYAHNNATIYGVEDKIDFINGDCFSLAPKLKADTIFLSPPWGGPDYLKLQSYDIDMLQPYDGQFLFNTFKVTASLIIMFLPRNFNVVQLAELSLSSETPWSLEVEKNFLNGKLKAVTAYFSRMR